MTFKLGGQIFGYFVRKGLGVIEIARILSKLMQRLGFYKYFVHGHGQLGCSIGVSFTDSAFAVVAFVLDRWALATDPDYSLNGATQLHRASINVATSVMIGSSSPRQASASSLQRRYHNMTRYVTFTNNGEFLALQSPSTFAEDIYTFVEELIG
uniref:Uncharacterized protein n=1 Tax=Parascaris univalens TaxID=6257 RepID=A0A915B1M6_PARUN